MDLCRFTFVMLTSKISSHHFCVICDDGGNNKDFIIAFNITSML